MHGAGRSDGDKAFHGRLVSAGCIACRVGRLETIHPLQIHHPDGRNKGRAGDHSERIAVCLCAEHHDQRIYSGYYAGGDFIPVREGVPSIHHAKRLFVEEYGSEYFLVFESYRILDEKPGWLWSEEWEKYLAEPFASKRQAIAAAVMKPEMASERRQKFAASC